MVKLIRRLENLRKKDAAQTGEKAAMLGEINLSKIGSVPGGFVVTADGFELFLEKAKLNGFINQTLKQLDYDDAKALNKAADAIARAIYKTPLGGRLEQAIAQAYRDLNPGDDEPLVAVRPSLATALNDGAPLAGPRLTFLNVKGARAVTAAVHKLFAQAYEPAALYYRSLHNLNKLPLRLGVVVQTMVFPEVSGVMVTTDPIMHDPHKLVIEAIWGLGDGLVAGTLTPDRFIIDKPTLAIVSQKISRQTWKLEYDHGLNAHISIPLDQQEKPKLIPEALIELSRIGTSLETLFHMPQEIEWAIDRDKNIWILDARPAFAQASARRTRFGWTIVPVKTAKSGVVDGMRVEAGAIGQVLAKGVGASIGLASGKVVIVHSPNEASEIPPGSVLVTEMTSPLYIQGMRQAIAIVTDTGGATSHASLVARELGIPCVVGTGQGTHVLSQGQMVTVDGVKGLIYKGKVMPDAIRDDHRNMNQESRIKNYGENSLNSKFIIHNSPITGTKVYVNLSEPDLAVKIASLAVDGVGLMRAELVIAQIGEHPVHAVKTHKTKEYILKLQDALHKVAQAFNPRPVMYRLNDFKTNEYRDLKGGAAFEPQEQNPMLGWRGARRYLDQPEVVNMELAALAALRASGSKNIHIVIPFIRTVSELKQVAFLIEKAGLQRGKDLKVWMMAEVPSNLLLLEQFAGVGIDGISIGTNDLTQLILGVDRDNERLAPYYDERDPAVLKAVTELIKRARGLGLTTSVCGNAASMYPEFLEAVVRSGITSVSITPDVTNETRKLIASIEKRILLEHAIAY